ncbi:hypothetical protein Y032_0149g2684 [Ancylostoma ceylanicum]|uniref:Uncharacterized protein n=1 Tax=Ancylostoma ceylanicum TaxID=53326 RepID=A0A016T1P5_9BILA|nr:hypothetical protein Y032_0149g2684 [Ancylostoma ceylanicum]
MSSASSVCSSNDIDYAVLDSRIPPAIRRDVERFSMFISRLRAALDVNTNVPGWFMHTSRTFDVSHGVCTEFA